MSGDPEVRVLLVDDQAPFLAAARGLVSRVPGFTVVAEASGGVAAVELAASTSPDLVLMDIRMPEVDGIAACREITSTQDPPVVVLLSTYDRSDLPEEVSTSGAAAYLHKEELTPTALVRMWSEHGHRLDSMIRVTDLDHIVVNAADVERSLAWYVDELGLEPIRVEEWRRGEVIFPSVRVNTGTIIDLVQLPRSGENIDHLCLVVEPTDLDAIAASGRFEVVDGPGIRYGARGDGTSLYIRDPDGNLVELRHYG